MDNDEEAVTARVRVELTMSLDGYVAGPDQSVENPLGVGGGSLHDWAFATRAFRASHGMEGGEAGIDDQIAAESLENAGATVMGRNMFGGGPGPWRDDEPWTGWWGDEPPFHTPVFVLTHHPRDSGARLFDLPPGWQDRYERTRLVASPAVAHFRYRRVG